MSLLTVGFDILGMSPLTIVWAALGLLEYINAAKCVRSPKAALAEADLVGADLLARGSEGAIRALALCYAGALGGLGTIRLAYALERPSAGLWWLMLLAHALEFEFWWAHATIPETARRVFALNAYAPDASLSTRANVLRAIRGGVNPLHDVLLVGFPGIFSLLLSDAPSSRAAIACCCLFLLLVGWRCGDGVPFSSRSWEVARPARDG